MSFFRNLSGLCRKSASENYVAIPAYHLSGFGDFTPATDELIDVLALTDNEKSLAKILLNTQIYPVDSNGRDRVFEIEDILHNLNGKIFDFQNNSEGSMLFGAVILALLELYNINEKTLLMSGR